VEKEKENIPTRVDLFGLLQRSSQGRYHKIQKIFLEKQAAYFID
jgi:hypothetical protein